MIMSGPEPAPLPARRSAGDLIASWRPSSVSPRAADFARAVVTGAAPGGRERAKNLLWAAGKLADYAIGCGLDPVPEVLFHSSVIERFAVSAPGLSGVARRTLRTNLRFLARRVARRWPLRTRRCPGNGARPRTATRRSPPTWHWLMPSRHWRAGCGRPGWSASGPAPG
jgi:hypothetical protein